MYTEGDAIQVILNFFTFYFIVKKRFTVSCKNRDVPDTLHPMVPSDITRV